MTSYTRCNSPTLLKSCLVLGPMLALGIACGPEGWVDFPEGDLPLGEMPEIKGDGWGHATTCKVIPSRPALADPAITISLNGLTLHLVDQATGLSRVYPVGVGAINQNSGETTFKESRTLFPVLKTGGQDFAIETAQVNPCRIWWHDKESGKDLPVFAGLPFMSFYGPYGVHGPVTQYTLPSGGKLKRGYVSHGCVRMEAAHVAELWAYIKDTPVVPVRVQKAVERDGEGRAVDLDQRWVLSECEVDSDCNFSGGTCRKNELSARGFCTAECDRLCDYDRFGYPVTFCVASGAGDGTGYCTYKASDFNYSCRRFEGFVRIDDEPRLGEPWVTAAACKPGSQGWIGDRCLTDEDCGGTRFCQPAAADAAFGFCTQSCTLYCPDAEGHAGTFCADGLCRAKCREGDDACPMGFSCSPEPRFNQPEISAPVCMPDR